ncbi:MAG TPA: pyridoxal-dependent decarboxylase [Longimicrobiales bacterium]|nr:pyridoxal-dependent decarboxylase [Longimicrobiales bacterium]
MTPDMNAQEFRAAAHEVVERIATFLQEPERWRVLPAVSPGEIRAALPSSAPPQAESFDDILADFDRLIMPATTHWNHPGFMAYFATTGSAPGILAEALIAALNVNAMLWRTGPAETELEEVTLGWLRQMIGLPEQFDGVINDTASSSTLYALAAAREYQSDLQLRAEGLAGRPEVPRLRVYCSEEAHSSVDKAVSTLGLGLSGVRRIPTDETFRMDANALHDAISADRAQGVRPIAVVATVGTTSTTAIDPVPEIANICEREHLWLHVDAAYGGSAAVIPEMRWVLHGCERAHSLVINPHKWMFVPMDCSVLYTARPDLLRAAFSLVPEYLVTAEGNVARNLMDYGVSLGRRFRALKLWFVLRYFGTQQMAECLREHIRLAGELEGWIREDATFELLAPRNFSVVVFRFRPDDASEEQLERLNARILDAVNASGEVFLSHTKVRGHYGLRVAIGNLRTTRRHVARAWELIRQAANLVEV